MRKDVGVALANDTAAVGELSRKPLQSAAPLGAAEEKERSRGTEPMVAADVRLGTVDAGIVWDTTVAQFADRLRLSLWRS